MENTENNMEFKNDGLPSEITNEQLTQMTDEQIEKMATTYSEGNDGLKSLLIYCAKNRIATFASCGGHPDKPEEDDPYIGFSLNMDSKSLLSKLFTREVNGHMRFLFHKFKGHGKLSIHIDKRRAASDFLQIQHDFEASKDISEPENDLFDKLFHLSSKASDDFLFLVCGDTYVSQNNESPLTIQIRNDIEYHYPMFPTSDSHSVVNELIDQLIYKADNNQDIESYLKLYNIKESCKHVPHMGLNLLDTVMQKMKNLGRTKEDERSQSWTK